MRRRMGIIKLPHIHLKMLLKLRKSDRIVKVFVDDMRNEDAVNIVVESSEFDIVDEGMVIPYVNLEDFQDAPPVTKEEIEEIIRYLEK